MARSPRGSGRCQRGSILVEFGFVVLLVYLLIAILIDFGRLFYSVEAAQDAVRSAARELSVIPLPADTTLTDALQDPAVRARVFQPEHLVIDIDNLPAGFATLEEFLDSLPVLNQALRPLMIFEVVGGQRLLHYPGTLLSAPDPLSTSNLTVGIPYVVGRDANGIETIRWVPVLEEIQNPNFPGVSPFSLNTPAGMPERGLVRVRINYPFQAALLTGYQTAGPVGTPNLGNPILADDAAVNQLNAAPGGILPDTGEVGPYAGPLGLGRLYAQSRTVRPWRKLISVQAVFRREVFE